MCVRSAIPWAGLLSAWLSACLAGTAHPEEMESALGAETLHLVAGLDDAPLSLTLALGAVRRAGGVAASLALPVPGDPTGLAGPGEFNAEALEAGEAVLLVGAGLGLVPTWTGDVVTWQAATAERARPLDPAETSANLRSALAEATSALVDLEVAHWQPEIADVLANLRHRPPPRIPRAYADRAVTVDRAALCLEIVELAQESDGAATSAHEVQARRAALDPLERAARHALVAALSHLG